MIIMRFSLTLVTMTLVTMMMPAVCLAGGAGQLKSPGAPLFWTGSVARGAGPVTEVPECAPGCDKFHLKISLPGGVWHNKPGGVQVAIRWTGLPFDNLRLYVYQNGALKARSDGIISISQGVLLREPADGDYQVYGAHDPDSPSGIRLSRASG